MKKVLVSLPDAVVNLLDTELTGKLGEGRSDTLRTIIMNWLGEQGHLFEGGKARRQKLTICPIAWSKLHDLSVWYALYFQNSFGMYIPL